MQWSLVGKRDSKTLAIGEAIVVKVVPPSTGYLYCYYQDAGAVNFLMSAEAGYITRQVLAVNGGLC